MPSPFGWFGIEYRSPSADPGMSERSWKNSAPQRPAMRPAMAQEARLPPRGTPSSQSATCLQTLARRHLRRPRPFAHPGAAPDAPQRSETPHKGRWRCTPKRLIRLPCPFMQHSACLRSRTVFGVKRLDAKGSPFTKATRLSCLARPSSISQTDAGGWGESWEIHRRCMGDSWGSLQAPQGPVILADLTLSRRQARASKGQNAMSKLDTACLELGHFQAAAWAAGIKPSAFARDWRSRSATS
jgi:hypothetical protein